MNKKFTIGIIFLFILVLGMGSAYALPTLVLDDGIHPLKTIVDGGILDSLPGTPGAVLYSGSIGNWTLTVDIGQTKPVIGNALDGVIDLNVTATTKASGGTLKIWWSDTGFLLPAGPAVIELATGGTTAGTVTVNGYADTGNTLFGTGTHIGTLGPYGAGAFSGTTSRVIASYPFSMTVLTTVTHRGAGTTTLDTSQAVPEPATLILFGSGLIGLGILGKRIRVP